MPPPREPRVLLRAPVAADGAAFVELRRASRAELEPFEAFPPGGPDPFSAAAFERFLATADSPRRRRRVVERREDGTLVGALSLTGIARGVLQSAALDYWLGTPFVGRGYMGEALALALDDAFGVLGLQRVEALVLPENARSRRLLERARFQSEGLARGVVRVRGEWRDHERWARIASDGGDQG
ncbi:MAG TPA: GNAT family protein [Planctomycetota bacterium]|nr:GNAT family protein [Planctomycetota bacterium]